MAECHFNMAIVKQGKRLNEGCSRLSIKGLLILILFNQQCPLRFAAKSREYFSFSFSNSAIKILKSSALLECPRSDLCNLDGSEAHLQNRHTGLPSAD